MPTIDLLDVRDGSDVEIDEDDEILGMYDGGGYGPTIVVLRSDNEEPSDEPYRCGYPLDAGGECRREVDGPDGRCWQHTDEE